MEQHGLEPAPERIRKTTWKEFSQRHWKMIVAADFFTVEVWTLRGRQRFLVLFSIELSTRRVRIASITRQANGLWMSQVARDLTDPMVIYDRDPLFTADFSKMLAEAGIESVRLSPRSPNLNAYAERFVRSSKQSCLDHLVVFGEASLRKAVREFIGHYPQRAKPPEPRQSPDRSRSMPV